MNRSILLFFVIATPALAVACSDAERSMEREATAPLTVSTATASMATLAERLEAGGVVIAADAATVSSRIVAPILAVNVRPGDRVRRDDVLIRLDARDMSAQARQATASQSAAEQALVQARAARAAAEADQKLAAAWHTRIMALSERNSATAQERDEADARLASASARLNGADAAIQVAESNIGAARAAAGAAATTESFATIRAPFDGVVTERLVDTGNLATPGVPLLRVESSGERRVEVTVDEARAAFVKVGDEVEVIIESAALPATTVIGRVSEVARAIAADRRAFSVKVILPAGEAIRTGTFARVRFKGTARKVVIVPANAVRRDGQVSSVFVVDGSTARLRLVQLRDESATAIEVLAGLDAGEVVVTSPPPGLADGHPVTAASTRGVQ
jgi:RND family efflux transporter MFP subunit